MSLIEQFKQELSMFRKAPLSFGIAFFVLAFLIGWAEWGLFKESYAHQANTIKALRDELSMKRETPLKTALADEPREVQSSPAQPAKPIPIVPKTAQRTLAIHETGRPVETDHPPANIPPLTQSAPNGINIGPGAMVPNPQVNNFGPPLPHLSFTEETTDPSPTSQRVLTVHIRTDRPISGAVIGLIFSGPVEIDINAVKISNAGAQQIDEHIGLARDGVPIPNSVALSVNIPASFSPSQEMIVPVKSKEPVHILQVVLIGG